MARNAEEAIEAAKRIHVDMIGTGTNAGEPARAIAVVMVITTVATVLVRILGVTGFNAWQYFGTIGTLLLLVAYALVDVGALKVLIARGTAAAWVRLVGPLLAILFLAFVLYNNLYPVPPSPFNVFPYIALVWLLAGLAIVLLVPGLAARIGSGLARQEGLTAPDAVEVSS